MLAGDFQVVFDFFYAAGKNTLKLNGWNSQVHIE